MSDIIRTEGLTKSFKTKYGRVDALRSIDMNVAEGEFVMLLGKSGCGKSTLLNIIGFMDSPDGGKVLLRRGGCFFPFKRREGGLSGETARIYLSAVQSYLYDDRFRERRAAARLCRG